MFPENPIENIASNIINDTTWKDEYFYQKNQEGISLKDTIVNYYGDELIFKPFKYTLKFYRQFKQTRDNGEPYICHPLRSAELVKEAGGDIQDIIVTLGHDIYEDPFSKYIQEMHNIHDRIDGLRINKEEYRDTSEYQKQLHIESVKLFHLRNKLVPEYTFNKIKNLFEDEKIGNFVAKQDMLLSFRYTIPMEIRFNSMDEIYNETTYSKYVYKIVNTELEYKINGLEDGKKLILKKLADTCTNNNVEGLLYLKDLKKIERSFHKANIVIESIQKGKEKGLELVKSEVFLFEKLYDNFEELKKTKYFKGVIIQESILNLNKSAANILSNIETVLK
jgi:hypothetical protein